MNIVSPMPLEVQFYDSRELKSGRTNGQSVRSLQEAAAETEDANDSVDSLAMLGDNHACHNVLSCVQLQEGLSKATVYNLMISRWANTSVEGELDQDDAPIRVSVELEHCDPVSPWHYVGLRTISKLQQAAQRDRFVELAPIDPLKAASTEKDCEEPEDSEEPTAPLMTTVITSDSKPASELETPSPA
ncbi:unnamed protein product [Phytophthora lilii]|uniref:Unnamed protein product n=1 Tax=Phytophthora lilii TaxID=2077276 RepID=A0A9W6U1F2_9STRA|nr:unnamed protein product [Phytophthora lilii]